MQFETSIISDRGGRDSNQDCARYAQAADHLCWTLADGLGGHGGGDLAANVAVNAILGSFVAHAECSPEALRTYLEEANRAIDREKAENPALYGMRTTIVALITDGVQALWGHVGDSRLYFFRGGRIAAMTKDHSVPQAMVDAGELHPRQIRFHEDRSRLLRSLGGGNADIAKSIRTEPQGLVSGDAFLMASDGLWEYITDTEMQAELAKASTPAQWLDGMVSRLRMRVVGEHDNYTAVAVFVR